ncbi:MAG: beta-galactosidase trimerization domain-containing protein [Clostridia bacterium]|nr:beta-galactosidase trimerization domain-containing protein [Clostridia bacterium]
MTEYVISITWGKSCNYVPQDVEELCWDGSLSLTGGTLEKAELLHYKYIMWSQAEELPETIHDAASAAQPENGENLVVWRSAVVPGGPLTLEGLRLRLKGNDETVVSLRFSHTQIRFLLRDLLARERLRFHAGGKYSGFPVDVFLGPDARPRLSRARFLRELRENARAGYLLTPDDFENSDKRYYHSMYGVEIRPSETICARFPVANYACRQGNACRVRIQLTAILGYEGLYTEQAHAFAIGIGDWSRTVSHIFTNRIRLPKLEEIHMTVPWAALSEENNRISVTHLSGDSALLLHRIAFGADPSMLPRAAALPALPETPAFYVGTETDLLTPANGDIDELLDRLHRERLGNYVSFRERAAWAPEADLLRWAAKVKEYGFLAATCGAAPETEQMLDAVLGDRYLGEQAHEISNLAYGWGEPDPIEERKNRTLKECKESYLKRMGPHRVVGQALPQQYLDYEAGVRLVMTEIPASHATLDLHAARGAANAFGRPFWGVHVANHVTRAPLDQDHVRRLFILLHQCWLHGASILQDEEVAYRYNHDTIYSYSDELPTAYRKIYQDIFHYANNITLGKPLVSTGFLQGNYDLLIGGAQAEPHTARTKVWGAFGPETECWEFDTPESGWKLLDAYMPGVWLYPVLQDRGKIRLFFTGSPNGQVDLVPITAPAETLLQYPVLILPGWNTMTREIYDNLCEYADRGGHLILCAAQCTEHVTRDFLKGKEDFAFIHNGDLTELAGVQVCASDTLTDAVCFDDETVSVNPGVRVLKTVLRGATVLAADRVGNPVVVEKRHTKGRVWLLCAGEYWGAEAFNLLRPYLCRRIVRENPQPIRLTGDTNDVDFYVFTQEDTQRIVLLNTDWTSDRNRKYVCVNTSGLRMETAVTEGRAKHILVKDRFALSFEVPSAIIGDFTVDGDRLSFTVSGAGTVPVEVFTDPCVRMIRSSAGERQGNTIRIDMGSTWSEREIVIFLQRTE